MGIDATVQHSAVAGTYRVVRHVPPGTNVTVIVPTRLDETANRPFRLAAAPTLRALRSVADGDTSMNVRLVVARPESAVPELVGLLDDELTPEWHVATVPGPWSIAEAISRALTLYPADVVVVVAPGLVPRDDQTPDWLGAMVGSAMSTGAGVVGAMIADRHDMVLHAGWDIPNYRWYKLEGLSVGSTTSGNDLLIEHNALRSAWPQPRSRRRTGESSVTTRRVAGTTPAAACRRPWSIVHARPVDPHTALRSQRCHRPLKVQCTCTCSSTGFADDSVACAARKSFQRRPPLPQSSMPLNRRTRPPTTSK